MNLFGDRGKGAKDDLTYEYFQDESRDVHYGSYDSDDGPSYGISASHEAFRWDTERDEAAEQRLIEALNGGWETKPDTAFARSFLSDITGTPASDQLYSQSPPKLCRRCGSVDIFSQDFQYTGYFPLLSVRLVLQLPVPKTQLACGFCALICKVLCNHERYLSYRGYDHEFEYY
jgi:hypothetical protein